MPKFSVKKPLTIFVAVIAILVLGVVAYTKMVPDLLPNMDFPYVVIMTPYPGASPEKVEAEVCRPMEQSMATLEHMKEVTSTARENVGMVMLEFEDSVNMDTIGIDIQQNISALESAWDSRIGTPYVLKINPSVLPVQVAAVSMEGMDNIELTDFLESTLLSQLEGVSGVANISTSGEIVQEVHIVLDQQKIDDLNREIIGVINREFSSAKKDLEATKEELTQAKDKLTTAREELRSSQGTLAAQTAAGEAQINAQESELISTKAELMDQLNQLKSAKSTAETTLGALKSLKSGVESLAEQRDLMQADVDNLLQLEETNQTVTALRKEFEDRIRALEERLDLTPEEIEAAIAAIRESEAFVQAEAAYASLQAQLAAYGLDSSTLSERIQRQREALSSIEQRLQDAGSALSAQGLSLDTLDTTITQMEDSLPQMEQGITLLEDTLTQLDSGLIQLQQASQMLSAQKASGLLEIANAQTEIAVNTQTVGDALTQVESGLTTVEDTRKSTLEKADLNSILTMDMIVSLLTAQNFSMPAGYVKEGDVSYMLSVGDKLTSVEEFENLLLVDLGMDSVEPIYLSDVALILLTDNRMSSYAKLDGADGIVLSFDKQSAYSTAETTGNIEKKFRELENTYPGLTFKSLMNQGSYIYLIVGAIMRSLLLGAVFAIVILFLFLKDLRPTLITLVAIPVSLVFAVVLMYFSGVTINMISLSGLAVAVGMLVDNSVVVIENIFRLRDKGASISQAAVAGAKQVAGAVTASTLTTVCVFLPIVFVEGITKQLFTDLALTLSYSLLASLIVSLTLVPAMASKLMKTHTLHKNIILDKIYSGYSKALTFALAHKPLVLLLSVVLLAGSFVFAVSRGFSFMPEADIGSITVSLTMPEDMEQEEIYQTADEVMARTMEIPGIETVGAMAGSGGIGGLSLGGGGASSITLYITLTDMNASGKEIGRRIEEACEDLPCELSVSSSMMSVSMLTGSGFTLELYAEDMDHLQDTANTIAAALSSVEGVSSVNDGLDEQAEAVHISIDRNKAMEKGMTVAQIYMDLAAALSEQQTATSLEIRGNTTTVIVEQREGAKVELTDLMEHEIHSTSMQGGEISLSLGEVGTLEKTTSLSTIRRFNQRRYVEISAGIAEGYNISQVSAACEIALADLELPKGVSYRFAGENEEIMEAMNQLLIMLGIGILLVYLVMVAQFQSLKSPFIVMFTIPLAFTGGLLGLSICGLEVSVISMIGFIMLTGIIVNNGIVLVDYVNQLRAEGKERHEAIVEGCITRMRPILMTSFTTILGLIDMALSSAAGTSLIQPVAVVCIGGLLYATLMTLFVVPCIYDSLNKKDIVVLSDEELRFD